MVDENEIMTLDEVASYFKIRAQIIINLVKEGEIPVFRIDDHIRIRKRDISDVIELLIKGEQVHIRI